MSAGKPKFRDPIKPVRIEVAGKKRRFDIDDPDLPGWVEDKELSAGGYPYDKRMKRDDYEETLERFQIELVKLQYWLQATGERVMVVFEGRDAAGKGGTIFVTRQYMNPRTARNGISSATSPISPPPASSSPSTAHGTTAPASSR
jgi:polyphosphate kinase 2 (PPK2 family)